MIFSFLNSDFHTFFFSSIAAVPRRVLKDQFDASVESDEPQQIDSEQNQDDLYDEDQFYRESEAIPPAPKLHRELATSDTPIASMEPSTSANPPLRSRDSSQLEGKYTAFLWLINAIWVSRKIEAKRLRFTCKKREIDVKDWGWNAEIAKYNLGCAQSINSRMRLSIVYSNHISVCTYEL